MINIKQRKLNSPLGLRLSPVTNMASAGARNTKRYAYTGVVVLLLVVSGAGGYALGSSTSGASKSTTVASGHTLAVLATFLPLEDWAAAVGGSRASVSLLVPVSVDVHEFEPSLASVYAVATANILVLNGAGLEPWAPALITSAGNSKLVVVNASDGISLIKVPPAFQSGNRTIDPHVWLDPVDAVKMVNNILAGYIRADPTDAAYFTANANAYIANLNVLNNEFVSLSNSNLATRDFVTFHTAFGYFAKQYNLTQIPVFGPFEEEPTAADITNVVNAINQNHLCYVGYESLENQAIPESIASQTHATLVPMNPIEGLDPTEQAQGQTYLTLMAQNYLVLSLALNHVGC